MAWSHSMIILSKLDQCLPSSSENILSALYLVAAETLPLLVWLILILSQILNISPFSASSFNMESLFKSSLIELVLLETMSAKILGTLFLKGFNIPNFFVKQGIGNVD